MTPSLTSWLALVIGNTRLHWGYFYQEKLSATWHTPHLSSAKIAQLQASQFQAEAWRAVTDGNTEDIPPALAISDAISEMWIASVVPAQTQLWTKAVQDAQFATQFVKRSHIPLQNLYPTFGLDRAMTLLGAGNTTGWPVLVIDGGTALTFTAGTASESGQGQLYGGAILPGLRLQASSLSKGTMALDPFVEALSQRGITGLPARWAMDSAGAIASGLSYSLSATLIDYLNDWWATFPNAHTVITGGDAPQLQHYLQQITPEVASRVKVDPNLMFYGVQAYRHAIIDDTAIN